MLIDSNIIIYAALPKQGGLRRFIQEKKPAVSAISYVEVLGYWNLTPARRRYLESFFLAATIFSVDEDVLEEATALRQVRSMSLGDALVAGTALVHGRSLVTHNVKDFEWIEGLQVMDPLEP